jgi:uncharacterized damage-inducible protein DinB
MTTDLRFPIGAFQCPAVIIEAVRRDWIEEIASLPARLRQAVEGLSQEQLDTPYRPDGWTVRQVVHHLADSHMNSLIRFKLALTEEQPTIKPYAEEKWAELADSKTYPIEPSLTLLDVLHDRWVGLLTSLDDQDYGRTFLHPESGVVTLGRNLGIYAWHGNHHLAHIASLKERMGW